jgi:hypothetical protein
MNYITVDLNEQIKFDRAKLLDVVQRLLCDHVAALKGARLPRRRRRL